MNDFYYSVCIAMFYLFDIYIDKQNFISLCSSNDIKFSYHIIVHIPNILFKNNIEINNFINHMYNFYSLSTLWVNGKDDNQYIIDKNVYTKNRAFRLYLSSKYNKNSILDFTNEYKKNNNLNIIRLEDFKKTLVIDYWTDKELKKISLLTCPEVKSECIIDNMIKISPGYLNDDKCNITKSSTDNKMFEPLITFIMKTFNNGEPFQFNAYIRNWVITYNEYLCTLLFNIEKYRWCGNINRQHKSNHIYFVVDISHNCYYQKCYDVDCKNYRSNPIQLSNDILLFTIKTLIEYFKNQNIKMPTILQINNQIK